MGADSQGNDAPDASQGQGAPGAPISNDDINRAITGRLKAFEANITKSLTAAFSTALEEKLAALGEKKPETPKDDGKLDEHPQFKQLQKQLSELKNKNAEADARIAEQTTKARETRMRGAVVEELAKHGVDAARARLVLPYLLEGKRIAIETDGDEDRVVWRGEHGDTSPIAEGLKAWASTEDAKIFLPPRGAAGSGEAPRKGSPGSAPASAEQKAHATLREGFKDLLT